MTLNNIKIIIKTISKLKQRILKPLKWGFFQTLEIRYVGYQWLNQLFFIFFEENFCQIRTGKINRGWYLKLNYTL